MTEEDLEEEEEESDKMVNEEKSETMKINDPVKKKRTYNKKKSKNIEQEINF